MIGQGKTVGIILIAVGLVVAAGTVFCLLPSLLEGKLQTSGFALGVVLAIVLVTLPLVAVGAFVLVRGRAEDRQLAEVAKERKLLNMVQSQGKVNVADAAVELDVPLRSIKQYIYD